VSGGTYDAANRQLTLGAKSMTYDFNGNLATLTEGGQTTTYTWDVRDRLTALSGPGLTASFTYDAEDRRTTRTASGEMRQYQNEGVDVTRETVAGAEANYLSGGLDAPLARTTTGGAEHYLTDTLGSIVALTDAGGSVTTSYTYEAFGRATLTGGPTANRLTFTAREDDSTGLYYYRARYYHPGLQRFIAEDPIGLVAGINFYQYVQNNPLTYVDPLGLQQYPPWPLPPSGIPGGPWRWSPNPQSGRGGAYIDPNGNIATWEMDCKLDPCQRGPGHWDVYDRHGNKQRYNRHGAPITVEEAHGPVKGPPRRPFGGRGGRGGTGGTISRCLGWLGLLGTVLDALAETTEEERCMAPKTARDLCECGLINCNPFDT
jgi:RHS repeat-associated protein